MYSEQSLATDQSSTADKTPLIPDLYTAYSPARLGSLDAIAGRSTEARGLTYALPAYDAWNTLARFCQLTAVRQIEASSRVAEDNISNFEVGK